MVDNTTVLASAMLEASTDYQQRVPDVTQAGVAQVSEFLFRPMNRKYLNEFMDIFVNRIAGEVVHQREFLNPIKRKREDILFGTTIQEIGLDFIKAHAYKDDWGHREADLTNLLKVYRPDGQVAYHSVNRYDQYPISINRMELRAAFTGEYGLNQLATAIMQVPYNSAEYDEYGIYKQLIAEHEYRHGFFKHQLAYPVDESTGKAFLRALRAYADKITIPSRLYNAKDATIPVWANRDEISRMVLYIEADAKASLDVDTLSAVFNLDKAEAQYRIQFIDSIPVPGAYALLTTEDFWMCADYDVSNDSFYMVLHRCGHVLNEPLRAGHPVHHRDGHRQRDHRAGRHGPHHHAFHGRHHARGPACARDQPHGHAHGRPRDLRHPQHRPGCSRRLHLRAHRDAHDHHGRGQ